MFRLAFLLVLAGCASSEHIELAPDVETAYEVFLAHPGRSHFAVSEDGRYWGYSICEGTRVCRGSGRQTALDYCERGGQRCVIYAVR